MRARMHTVAAQGMWAEFVNIVEASDRAAAQATVTAARQDVALALAMYESARTRKWVRPDGATRTDESARRTGWLVAGFGAAVVVGAVATLVLAAVRGR